MRRRTATSAIVAAICVALAGSRSAAQTLDGFQAGRTISGAAWTAAKLDGHPVLIVLWNAGLPPSLPLLARAAKLDKELSPYGLIVIGPHLTLGPKNIRYTDAQIGAKTRAAGVHFSVCEGLGIKGVESFSVPNSYVYNADGSVKFLGPIDKGELKARIAVGQAIVSRAGERTYSKMLLPIADALKAGSPPGPLLNRLVGFKNDADAKALVDAICEPSAKELQELGERVESEPVNAYNDSQRISMQFKGTPLGTQASELFTKLKSDKKVAIELKAQPTLEKLQKVDEALEKKADGEPINADFIRMNQTQVAQVRTISAQIQSSWPNSRAAAEAVDIAAKYGIQPK
jgi:hypothetical protein